MKVIYKRHIFEKIDDAIFDAMKFNKTIEKIILTKSEHDELYELFQNLPLSNNSYIGTLFQNGRTDIILYNGITIEVENES